MKIFTVAVLLFHFTFLNAVDGSVYIKQLLNLRSKRETNKCYNSGTWDKRKRRCSCKLGWVGKDCTVWRYNECYFDDGYKYGGNVSVTKSGKTCLPWTSPQNTRFDPGKDGIGLNNYCRNPDKDEGGVWCYVGGKEFHEYCDVTKCPDEYRALLLVNATEYDDSSAAVQFVFGPLISGICVGVVALLVFIVVAEYLRRRRNAKKKKKIQQNALKKSDIQHPIHTISTEPEVRTFGGIVTVDVDTGIEKSKIIKMQNQSKASAAIKASAEDSSEFHHSNAFVMDDSGKITSAGSPNIQNNQDGVIESPPPPYDAVIEDYSSVVISNPNFEDIQDGGNTAAAMSTTSPEAAPKPKKRPKKKRPVRSNNSKVFDTSDTTTPPAVTPVPKPRKSLMSANRETSNGVEQNPGNAENQKSSQTKRQRNSKNTAEKQERRKRREKQRQKKMLQEKEKLNENLNDHYESNENSPSQNNQTTVNLNDIEQPVKSRRKRIPQYDNETSQTPSNTTERRHHKSYNENKDITPRKRNEHRKKDKTQKRRKQKIDEEENDVKLEEAIKTAIKSRKKKENEPSTFI